MLNEKFIQDIIDQNGLPQAIWFCEHVSKLNEQIYNEIKSNPNSDPTDYAEFDYQRYWWDRKAQELKNT